MFIVSDLDKIKATNQNTFAHAFFALYERRICGDQVGLHQRHTDRVLYRLFWNTPNKIMETMNGSMPVLGRDIKTAKSWTEMTVRDWVGPQFHKMSRQVDVTGSGHRDMAIYILLANCDVQLYWQTLEEISIQTHEFIQKDHADWHGFIFKHTNEVTLRRR